MTEPVTWARDGAVVTLTLSSPETRNAISVPQTDAIVEGLARADADPEVGCVIIAAEGDIFSAGGNIKDMHARRGHFAGGVAETRRYYLNGSQRMAQAFHALEVPAIAAVNGPAIGAGFDIALMCDLRIASERAVFAESFVNLGLVSAAGGAWFLGRAVGPALAAELTLTGDRIDAARALQLGIVSRVTPHDELMAEARTLAARIARHSPIALRLNKRLLRESAGRDLSSALEAGAALQAIAQHTDDHREAVAAVIEKRTPSYTGR